MFKEYHVLVDIIIVTVVLVLGLMSLILASGDRVKTAFGGVLMYVFAVYSLGLVFFTPMYVPQLLNPISLLCVLPASMPILLFVYRISYRGPFLVKRVLSIFLPAFLLFICYALWGILGGKVYVISNWNNLLDRLFTFDVIARILMLIACLAYAVHLLFEIRRASLSVKNKRTLRVVYRIRTMTYVAYWNVGMACVFLVSQLYQEQLLIGLYRMASAVMFFTVLVVFFKSGEEGSEDSVDGDVDEQQEEGIIDIAEVLNSKEAFEHYFCSKKPFLDADLTLPELASILNTNRTTLSAFIKNEYDMNFSWFINGYRVQEFKRLVEENAHESISIDGLSVDSGFRSRSTFYRSFAEIEKITPSLYIQQRAQG